MNEHSNYSISDRKIDPTRVRPDGTPDDDDRIETGPTKQAFDEWAAAGLEARMRERLADAAYAAGESGDSLAALIGSRSGPVRSITSMRWLKARNVARALADGGRPNRAR